MNPDTRTIELFDAEKHYLKVQSWYAQRHQTGVFLEYLPKIGMVADGIAAGWMWQTDSKSVFFGSFVVDHDASAEDRDAALELLIEGLRRQAQALGYEQVIAWTKVPGMSDRMARWGMVGEKGYNVMTGPVDVLAEAANG